MVILERTPPRRKSPTPVDQREPPLSTPNNHSEQLYPSLPNADSSLSNASVRDSAIKNKISHPRVSTAWPSLDEMAEAGREARQHSQAPSTTSNASNSSVPRPFAHIPTAKRDKHVASGLGPGRGVEVQVPSSLPRPQRSRPEALYPAIARLEREARPAGRRSSLTAIEAARKKLAQEDDEIIDVNAMEVDVETTGLPTLQRKGERLDDVLHTPQPARGPRTLTDDPESTPLGNDTRPIRAMQQQTPVGEPFGGGFDDEAAIFADTRRAAMRGESEVEADRQLGNGYMDEDDGGEDRTAQEFVGEVRETEMDEVSTRRSSHALSGSAETAEGSMTMPDRGTSALHNSLSAQPAAEDENARMPPPSQLPRLARANDDTSNAFRRSANVLPPAAQFTPRVTPRGMPQAPSSSSLSQSLSSSTGSTASHRLEPSARAERVHMLELGELRKRVASLNSETKRLRADLADAREDGEGWRAECNSVEAAAEAARAELTAETELARERALQLQVELCQARLDADDALWAATVGSKEPKGAEALRDANIELVVCRNEVTYQTFRGAELARAGAEQAAELRLNLRAERKRRSHLAARLDSVRARQTELKTALASTRAALDAVGAERDEAREELSALSEELETVQRRAEKAERSLEKATAAVEREAAIAEEAREETDALRAELANARKGAASANNAQKALEEVRDEAKELRAELKKARQEGEAARKEMARSERERRKEEDRKTEEWEGEVMRLRAEIKELKRARAPLPVQALPKSPYSPARPVRKSRKRKVPVEAASDVEPSDVEMPQAPAQGTPHTPRRAAHLPSQGASEIGAQPDDNSTHVDSPSPRRPFQPVAGAVAKALGPRRTAAAAASKRALLEQSDAEESSEEDEEYAAPPARTGGGAKAGGASEKTATKPKPKATAAMSKAAPKRAVGAAKKAASVAPSSPVRPTVDTDVQATPVVRARPSNEMDGENQANAQQQKKKKRKLLNAGAGPGFFQWGAGESASLNPDLNLPIELSPVKPNPHAMRPFGIAGNGLAGRGPFGL